ncbi:MAG: hemin uptake protein HemP [Celeribacter sp.]
MSAADENRPAPSAAETTTRVPHYDVRQLIGPEGRATIGLEGQVYTLRITRANKLILTK